MTFIKSQAESLRRHRPVYVGAHRVDGIELPEGRSFVVNEGSILGTAREAVFRLLGQAPRLVGQLRRFRPVVVHAHFGTCGPAAMSLAEALNLPLVVTFHGQDATMTEAEARKTHRGRELYRKKEQMIERAHVFIAVSDYIRNALLSRGYPDNKIIVHRNGIDLGFFSPAPQIGRENTILFVGRFVEKKGAVYLLEAARMLKESGVDFELVMIGDGPLAAELRDRASRYGIPCKFSGFLPVNEVREWLARSRVVAVPSVVAANGDSEGLPTVLLEAQAMATAVVATRHSGIPEGVLDGKTAELVEERDSAALASKLKTFLESPDKALQFGEAGRRFVTEHFDMRTQVDGLEDIYEATRQRA